MSGRDLVGNERSVSGEELSGADLLRPLVEAQPLGAVRGTSPTGVVIGELIGMTSEGRNPLILYPGQPGSTALAARTVIDLHGPHIGCKVVLTFEDGDPGKPIVMGILRESEDWPLAEQPGQLEVDLDGERLIISAKEQLVLRCGEASITLTRAGKVVIRGTYLLSRSSGVNRVTGGSVQIN